MFNNFAYADVTREERFFCALFAHALLMSPIARQQLSTMARNDWKVDLDPDTLEVYLEPATLRDYWHDLGSPFHYSEDPHLRRQKIIEAILALNGLPAATLHAHDFFWTTTAHRKLWSPGRWSLETPAAKLIDAASLERLRAVKWAFNAKPDLLIVSGQTAILIEAKVESGEGMNAASDYRQLRIQQKIIELLRALHPSFEQTAFVHLLLDVTGAGAQDLGIPGLAWRDVVGIVDTPELDAFTQRCLAQLRRYEHSVAVSSHVGRQSDRIAMA